MLLLLLFPLAAAQICISDYDCASQERCLPYSAGVKRCSPPYGAYATVSSSPLQSKTSPSLPPNILTVSWTATVSRPKSVSSRPVEIVPAVIEHKVSSVFPFLEEQQGSETPCVSDQDCGPRGVCSRQPNGATRCALATGGVVQPLSRISSYLV